MRGVDGVGDQRMARISNPLRPVMKVQVAQDLGAVLNPSMLRKVHSLEAAPRPVPSQAANRKKAQCGDEGVGAE